MNKTKEIKSKFYYWGNGKYQAKPDNNMTFENFFPHLIKNLSNNNINLIDVEFGKYLDAGIDINKNLIIWDKLEFESNNTNNKNYEVENIKTINNIGKVRQLKFTDNFLWILLENNKLFQYKIINNDNNFSLSKNIREIKSINNIKKISSNKNTLIMLKNDGDVYSMGDDTLGQCGISKNGRTECGPYYEEKILNPKKIETLKDIIDIDSGEDHSIAVSKYNIVYGWGSNKSCQLHHFLEFSRKENPMLCSFEPVKINNELDFLDIEKVVCGGSYTIIIGENRNLKEKEVYSFGKNLNGQLGNNYINHISPLFKMESLSNFKLKNEKTNKKENVFVEKIKCGKNHCICLLNEGHVLTWGSNKYGQLGNKKRSFKESPIIVKKFNKEEVLNIFANNNATGALIKNN